MARETLIQILYGLEMNIGTLNIGELGYCTDTKKLYIGTATGNELLVAAQTVGDMLKSIYDTDNDGIVDAAEVVNGHTVLSDVPANAKFTDTVYTHPTTSGNKHIPSGGSSGQTLEWIADGTAIWKNGYAYPTRFGGSDNGTARWTKLCTIETAAAYVNLHEKLLIQDRYGNAVLTFEGLTGATYNSGQGFNSTIQNMDNNGYTASQIIIGQKTDTANTKTYWDIWVYTNTWSSSLYQVISQYFNGVGKITFYTDIYLSAAPSVSDGYDIVRNPTTDLFINGSKILKAAATWGQLKGV